MKLQIGEVKSLAVKEEEEVGEETTVGEMEDLGVISCPNCAVKLRSVSEWNKHMKSCVERSCKSTVKNPFACERCDKIFPFASWLLRHQKTSKHNKQDLGNSEEEDLDENISNCQEQDQSPSTASATETEEENCNMVKSLDNNVEVSRIIASEEGARKGSSDSSEGQRDGKMTTLHNSTSPRKALPNRGIDQLSDRVGQDDFKAEEPGSINGVRYTKLKMFVDYLAEDGKPYRINLTLPRECTMQIVLVKIADNFKTGYDGLSFAHSGVQLTGEERAEKFQGEVVVVRHKSV